VQLGQRVAASGMSDAQNGHAFIVASSSRRNRLYAFTTRKARSLHHDEQNTTFRKFP
jgi:hypothetical protein